MSSFDIVSRVDIQEVRNAVDQAARELVNRYDFKGTATSVSQSETALDVESSTEERLKAAVDVVKEKLVRRKVSLKSLSGGEPKEVGGGRFRSSFTLNQGIDMESARELSKFVKGLGLKVQAQINDDIVRVTGKKRDELQAVIAEVKALDFKLPLQFVNYRD